MIRAATFVSRHFTGFACLAYLIGWVERVAEMVLHDGPLWALRSNNLTQYFVTYWDHGFAKRALVGTVLRPLLLAVDRPELWAFWIMVALNVAGFAGVLWLVRRHLPHDPAGGVPAILRAALAVGSVGVVQIAHDYGRLDLINYGVLALALWLSLRRRAWAAGLAGAAGILIHEAFAIYAVPLILATAWRAAPPGRWLVAAGAVVLPAATAALAVLAYGNSGAAAALDIGTGAYVWQRGLIEIGWTMPLLQALILALYWLALLTLLFGDLRPGTARPDLLTLAALSPAALNLFGIDHGRWLTIAVLIAATALTLRARHFGHPWPNLSRRQKQLACLLALPLGPHGVTGAWTWMF
ncbi:MAG: hypothetical protein QNJ16_13325 [Rhodobacter sp.]|nr:hypothetical protein [Rhodobacter sp.]